MIRAFNHVRPSDRRLARALETALRACDGAVAAACWMTVNLLAALGMIVILFAAAGHLSFAGFFLELGHLAAHYRSASTHQQSAFQTIVIVAVTAFAAGFAALRLGSLRTLAARMGNTQRGIMAEHKQ